MSTHTKVHRPLAEACVQLLEEIFAGNTMADRAVGRALGAHPNWGARDRAFVAATVYEVVRWRRRLAWLAGANDWPALAGMHWALRGFPRPGWAAWPDISPELREQRMQSLADGPRAVRESLSDELDGLGENQLGAQWDTELAAMNRQAEIFLRVNPLRSSLAAVIAELAEQGIATSPVEGASLALRTAGARGIPAKLRLGGKFEIQDAGSQQVAPFLQVEPGQMVVDACAGAGGKTLHLAALMSGRGELHALDVHPEKLEVLNSRAARAGVSVQTAVVSPAILEKLDSRADRVLVDAPCSGTGTLRRQPDLKYRITSGLLMETMALQHELLAQFACLVRPGGKLVYATCSILPSENEKQAEWFSAQHSDFAFEEERRISPAATGWDGFYMVRWRRTAR